jgi:hypothetical protein
MSGRKNEKDDDDFDDDSSDDTLAATLVMSDDEEEDTSGDSTVEVDIENLVAKLDTIDSDDVHRRAEIRHKLEELRELREQERDSTFNFSLDDD